MSFVLASVKAGQYLLLDNMYTTVVADIQRVYKPAPVYVQGRKTWWSDGYALRWRETGVEERFKTLAEINEIYYMINYPGYGGVLSYGQSRTSETSQEA